MSRLLVSLAMLAALLAAPAAAQPATGSWQVYTSAQGLTQPQSSSIAPDGAGGVWVGHEAKGQLFVNPGGLAHATAQGGQSFTQEPFVSCPSVDDLAAAPGGIVWLRLSGFHEIISDSRRQCGERYGVVDETGREGVAIGFVGADGVPQLLPREQLPPELVRSQDGWAAGIAVDAQSRLWAGTRNGVAVREADGSWRVLRVWQAGEGGTFALAMSLDGTTLALGSVTGDVATITIRAGQAEQVRVLPRPIPERPAAGQFLPVGGLAFGPEGLGVTVGRALYRQAGDGWVALELPSLEASGLTYHPLAYAGGTWWAGVARLGLYRLDGQSWTAVRAGETPLPHDHIADLVAPDANTLLIATASGAARLSIGGPAPDPRAAQQAFDALWQRTNRGADGGWVWGPRAWAERYEPYLEAPGGSRLVRYYDKARMEVTRPYGDVADPYYVTNGLLVTEMVTGKVQFGDGPVRGGCHTGYFSLCPSYVVVAGDRVEFGQTEGNRLAPVYDDFLALLGTAPQRVGAPVSATLIKKSDLEPAIVGDDPSLASEPTRIAHYDSTTQHNISDVFWRYLQAQPVDWLYSFGHPITEPYWIRTQISGVEQLVLVQLFERRTLTYTPSNPVAWQVEMGNVGQHYFEWRYALYSESDPPWE